jgi:hypothetical protein
MFTVSGRDVINLGRTSGGDAFTEFVDSVIRAQAAVVSIPLSSVHTNCRTNKQDGGVDTKLDIGITVDPTGWMREKTIWQFKAVEANSITDSNLRNEICKWFSKECIEAGFSYRFCLCDSIAAYTKTNWKSLLTAEARTINPNSPEAEVLTADDLAAWVSKFPAIVLRIFRQAAGTRLLTFDSWASNQREITGEYISVPTWQPNIDRIIHHVDWSQKPKDPVLHIQGWPGVGKTRLVCETLATVHGAQQLVICTEDEDDSRAVAQYLVNDPNASAILVADESSVDESLQIERIVKGHAARIRAITIYNTPARPAAGSPEPWVMQIDRPTLDEILKVNFADQVPTERRRAYAEWSENFVRFAAYLCLHDSEIQGVAPFGVASPEFRNYLLKEKLLTPDELDALCCIALLPKVGFARDVETEIQALCKHVDVDFKSVVAAAHRLHRNTGFIGRGGRFFYVTPKVIADVAFEFAWQKWTNDIETFLGDFPSGLVNQFLDRVARSAHADVRKQVSDFFLQWGMTLRPPDLTKGDVVERIANLCYAHPEEYLPILRRLVEAATKEDLADEEGEYAMDSTPRREIVWLCERFAAFPEFFADAEAILLRLAIAESEPGIGNNATGIWTQLYRLVLPGTAVPFLERLSMLKERLHDSDQEVRDVAFRALERAFEQFGTHAVGPAVIAGRITPADWMPGSQSERKACFDGLVALLVNLSSTKAIPSAVVVRRISFEQLDALLQMGYLDQLQEIFALEQMTVEERAALKHGIDGFLMEAKRRNGMLATDGSEYFEQVAAWARLVTPTDLHGRLVAAVSVDQWHHDFHDQGDLWKRQLRELAKELLDSPSNLDRELKWLCSENARSAATFGYALAHEDPGATVLEPVFTVCAREKTIGLCRGYVYGMADSKSRHFSRLNSLIDALSEFDPQTAQEISLAGGRFTNSLQRTLELVDSGRLGARALASFSFGVDRVPLEAVEFKEVLKRFVCALERGDTDAAKTAVRFLGYRLDHPAEHDAVLDDPEIAALSWQLVEAAAPEVRRDLHWWLQALNWLAKFDPGRAIEAACAALQSTVADWRQIDDFLQQMAANNPAEVINCIGKLAIDSKAGWSIYLRNLSRVVEMIPAKTVLTWVDSHGIRAARRIARQLPGPYLDDSGRPVVPEVTELILTEFGSDEDVFAEFCMGRHSGQIHSAAAGSVPKEFGEYEATARKFLTHPNEYIRRWAAHEIEYVKFETERWVEHDAEMLIE